MATQNNTGFDFDVSKTLDDIIIEVERDYNSTHTNLGRIQTLTLKNGPNIFRFVTFRQILKHSTQEHHHNVLTINTYKRLKGGWKRQDEKSISLDDELIDEIGLLETFIQHFNQYTNYERRIYKIILNSEYEKFIKINSLEISDTINNILEDPTTYDEILKKGGATLM